MKLVPYWCDAIHIYLETLFSLSIILTLRNYIFTKNFIIFFVFHCKKVSYIIFVLQLSIFSFLNFFWQFWLKKLQIFSMFRSIFFYSFHIMFVNLNVKKVDKKCYLATLHILQISKIIKQLFYDVTKICGYFISCNILYSLW